MPSQHPDWQPVTAAVQQQFPGLAFLNFGALPQGVRSVLRSLKHAGGRPLLVGGLVRDAVLGLPPKDFDIEVFGLERHHLEQALTQVGQINLVGKSFGVIKVLPFSRDVHEFDVSLPRLENKTGRGIKGFITDFPPTLTLRQAAMRRDYTINAFAYDPFEQTFFDFFDGLTDLKQRVLRHIGPAFAEDPERVRRGMQFAARLGMTVAPETAQLCQHLLSEADTSPKERIWAEWRKWATRGLIPSLGLKFLHQAGWLATVPELAALVGCPQDPMWHPEGDAWLHTQHVCDAAAHYATQHQCTDSEREILLFASLCHDLGKPATTITTADGHIRSPNHATAGIPLTEQLLNRIGAPHKLIAITKQLTQCHMDALFYAGTWQKDARATVQQLAERLHPATVRQWELLVAADSSGRPPMPYSRPAASWLALAEQLACADHTQPDIIQGRDLIQWGLPPSPLFSQVLRKIRTAQLKNQFTDRTTAIQWILSHCNEIQLVKGRDLLALGYSPSPKLGKNLRDAFALQLQGAFKTKAQALNWLKQQNGD